MTRMKTEVMIMRRMPSSTPRMMVNKNVIKTSNNSCHACRVAREHTATLGSLCAIETNSEEYINVDSFRTVRCQMISTKSIP